MKNVFVYYFEKNLSHVNQTVKNSLEFTSRPLNFCFHILNNTKKISNPYSKLDTNWWDENGKLNKTQN